MSLLQLYVIVVIIALFGSHQIDRHACKLVVSQRQTAAFGDIICIHHIWKFLNLLFCFHCARDAADTSWPWGRLPIIQRCGSHTNSHCQDGSDQNCGKSDSHNSQTIASLMRTIIVLGQLS